MCYRPPHTRYHRCTVRTSPFWKGSRHVCPCISIISLVLFILALYSCFQTTVPLVCTVAIFPMTHTEHLLSSCSLLLLTSWHLKPSSAKALGAPTRHLPPDANSMPVAPLAAHVWQFFPFILSSHSRHSQSVDLQLFPCELSKSYQSSGASLLFFQLTCPSAPYDPALWLSRDLWPTDSTSQLSSLSLVTKLGVMAGHLPLWFPCSSLMLV